MERDLGFPYEAEQGQRLILASPLDPSPILPPSGTSLQGEADKMENFLRISADFWEQSVGGGNRCRGIPNPPHADKAVTSLKQTLSAVVPRKGQLA